MNRFKILALSLWAVATTVLAVTVVQQRSELDELREKQGWMEAERHERESRSEEAIREAKRILDEVLKKAVADPWKDSEQAAGTDPGRRKRGTDPSKDRREQETEGDSAKKRTFR